MSSMIFRRFGEEVASFVGKSVSVETKDSRVYSGRLAAVDERLNIVLDGVTGAGEGVYKLVVNGDSVREIKLVERPFDLKGLAERLSRVFPGLVTERDDLGLLMVMEKVKVTEKGVEGTGIAADRVRSIFDEYVRETKKA
jgi:small nuclear ribonucleoprotein (snRNP)-like protein